MLSYVSLHFRIFELNCLLQQIIMIWMETNILFQVQAKVGQRVKANLLRVATLQVVFGILYYKL